MESINEKFKGYLKEIEPYLLKVITDTGSTTENKIKAITASVLAIFELSVEEQ